MILLSAAVFIQSIGCLFLGRLVKELNSRVSKLELDGKRYHYTPGKMGG
jgi:hypothetical protein